MARSDVPALRTATFPMPFTSTLLTLVSGGDDDDGDDDDDDDVAPLAAVPGVGAGAPGMVAAAAAAPVSTAAPSARDRGAPKDTMRASA